MTDSLGLENGTLEKSQIEQYWQDGYLFPIRVMPEDKAKSYRADLEKIENEWLDNGLPKPLSTYKRVNAHTVMPLAYEVASDPALLDVIEGILGPNIMIYGAEFFIKEAHTNHIVTMHQDLTYWGLGSTSKMVTAWLSLSPATPASGCMNFVQGSHKNPILPHKDSFAENNLLSRGQEIAVDVADEDKVAIEIHPGQISLHHGLTIHGSGPNITDDRRIALVIRYIAPEVAQEVSEKDFAMLVRGEDKIGNFEHVSPPSGLFQPDDLKVYEKIRLAQAQATMKDAKASGTQSSTMYG